MPFYKIKNTLIITNHKVMSSSLNHTLNLKRLTRISYLNLLYSLYSKRISKTFLVRDPYKKTISVFNNKFRDFNVNQPQAIHKLFFKAYCQKNPKTEKNDFNKIIATLTFNEYLELLKEVYFMDTHTIPQSKKIDMYKLKLENLNIIKIEDKEELNSFFESLGLVLPQVNKSRISKNIELNENQKNLIFNLYKRDFEIFNYTTNQ